MSSSNKNNRKNYYRFCRQLKKEVDEHDKKLQSGKLSCASGLGKLSIVVSNAIYEFSPYEPEDQINAFHEEADVLSFLKANQHEAVRVVRQADLDTIAHELADPEVTDMIFIGHGDISNFWLDNGKVLGWRRVAQMTKFLKQGEIEQRMCGNFPRVSSVPLGTFAVADQTRLIAPVGKIIADINPDETDFMPVYDRRQNTEYAIRELISSQHIRLVATNET